MIEQVLHRELAPLVQRRRQLLLTRRLTLCWLMAILGGLVLMALQRLLGWESLWPAVFLGVGPLVLAFRIKRSAKQWGPDYHAIAQAIEQKHPDAKALILAAIEQRPDSPMSGLSYLQQAVIKEALGRAIQQDWDRSVPVRTLRMAQAAQVLALIGLLVTFSQFIPSREKRSLSPSSPRTLPNPVVTVDPGDASLEAGTSVVITARFSGGIPSDVALVYGPAQGDLTQRQVLNQNLKDPVFGGMIEQVDENLVYHIEFDGRQSEDFRLDIFTYPQMLQADAHIIYPAYTKCPDKTLANTRRFGVVEGSRVGLTFTLNKPVTEARLVLYDGEAIELDVDANEVHLYHTDLVASEDQRFKLLLKDADGRANKVPPHLEMEVHKNLPPEFKITFPGRDIEVSPLEELTLEGQVRDDYGLMAYGYSYKLAGLDLCEVELGSVDASREEQTIGTLLSLEDLKAEPDQVLTYYFWADDIGPDGLPRRTTTDMFFAEVRHFDQRFREVGGGRGQKMADLAELQKNVTTATWNLKQRSDQSAEDKAYKTDLELVRDSQAEIRDLAQVALSQASTPEARQPLQDADVHIAQALDALEQALDSEAGDDLIPAVAMELAAYQELLKLRVKDKMAPSRRNRANNKNPQRFNDQLRQLELKQRQDRYETQRLAQVNPQQQETLELMKGLQELARRQQEVSGRLQEIQAALQQAQDEPERQKARRELERLRDEQMQAVEDADRLQQRMERPVNRNSMADARQQMEATRQRIQESTEQLQKGQIAQAVTHTTRAQRELEEMREDLRRNAAHQFTRQMREMRRLARDLTHEQDAIARQLNQPLESGQRDHRENPIGKRLAQQKQRVQELMEQMKDVSEEAEQAEPLLSRKLYETLRQASTGAVDRALDLTRQLLERNLVSESQHIEKQAHTGLEKMREGIEDAARGILGDEAEALQLARSELDSLIRQVQQEAEQALQRSTGETSLNAQGPASVQAQGQGQRLSTLVPLSQGGDGGAAPLTSGDYIEWSDRLRDVEEMLEFQTLRNEAAQVRDRAQTVRADFIRHGTEPQWEVVIDSIIGPLLDLRQEVANELARLRSDEALVPIDRDPVPDRYAERVRRYFENLGEPQL